MNTTAFALPAGEGTDWDDPEVRARLARFGRRVELRARQRASIELPIAPESHELP